jgi:hypothetical protein
MNVIDRPPEGPHRANEGPDELDGLLRAFFQAEMPHPWPGVVPPALPMRPAARPWPLFRSRSVLAASVAALLLGSLSLSSAFQGSEAPNPAVKSDKTVGARERPVKKLPPPDPMLESSKVKPLPHSPGKHP